MTSLISGLAMLACSVVVCGQDLTGAWKLINTDGKPANDECIKIYSDGYFMFGVHSANGAFIKAGGGKYSFAGNEYIEVLDFNTSDSTLVRKPVTYAISMKKDELTLSSRGKGTLEETWKKVDNGATAVNGTWRFGARVNDDGVAGERRSTESPRQTMKILSGKYFQWAAFNYETKEFSGTGGGTYVLQNDKYTETIRFFSRDNARAGMSLTFDCRLDGTDWYHKGKGTTGNPVSEVWEKVK
jgi:hypothetical protein